MLCYHVISSASMLDAGICAVSLEPKIGMMGEERESAAGSSDPGQAKEHRRRNDI